MSVSYTHLDVYKRQVQVFRHAKDGSSATAFLVTNNTEYKKYESWRAQRQYLFADYNNGKLSNKYDDTFSLSPLFMNQDHDLWASTDPVSYTHLDVYKRQACTKGYSVGG